MSVTIGAYTLTEQFGTGNGDPNRRTFYVNGHTIAKPLLVIQKHKAPSSVDPNAKAISNIKVVVGTEDADGAPMQGKIAFDLAISYAQGSLSTDVDAGRAIFQAIVANALFTTVVDTGVPLTS